MSTPLAALIDEILARPEVIEARRKVELADALARQKRRQEAKDAPVVQRPLERFSVRGTWEAHEVEPFLASPRSSLNPAFILSNGDEV